MSLASAAEVPVINGLTDLLHPCQALADMLTILEKKGRPRGLKLAYLGDGDNNVTHSLLHTCSKLGMDIAVACPKGYAPDKTVLKEAMDNAARSGSLVEVTSDPKRAAKGADVLYTDTWSSMSDGPGEEKWRERAFRPFQLNSNLMDFSKPGSIVMHCLPAHRGKEITSEVLDGKRSAVLDQAENRLHTEKAILAMIYG